MASGAAEGAGSESQALQTSSEERNHSGEAGAFTRLSSIGSNMAQQDPSAPVSKISRAPSIASSGKPGSQDGERSLAGDGVGKDDQTGAQARFLFWR